MVQKKALQKYIKEHKINRVKLNPNQLYDFYTIPHALLYDLRKKDIQLDCLIIFSNQVIEDFIFSYPAKWLIIKSYFKKIIILEEQIFNKKVV
jgi:hypothetical protein